MAARFFSIGSTGSTAFPQGTDEQVRHDAGDRTNALARAGARSGSVGRVLAFTPRAVVAAAAVALLLGAAGPSVQDAAAHTADQVEPVQRGVVWAPSAGLEYVNIYGVDPAPGYENSEIVPADPNVSGDVQPVTGGIEPAE